jgi:ribose/xylose/arabinose/galactoside ABC-type transport system permease subunit
VSFLIFHTSVGLDLFKKFVSSDEYGAGAWGFALYIPWLGFITGFVLGFFISYWYLNSLIKDKN